MASSAGTLGRCALRSHTVAANSPLLSFKSRAVQQQNVCQFALPACQRGPDAIASSAGAASAESAAFLLAAARQVDSGRQVFSWDTSNRQLAVWAAADAVLTEELKVQTGSLSVKEGFWTWRYNGQPIKIKHMEVSGASSSSSSSPPVLLLPAYSDVSTVDEWKDVASMLAGEAGVERRFVICDWPGFGESDRPGLDYTADVMEQFLVDFVKSSDGPLGGASSPVIVGAGHAATAALRATSRGHLTPAAIAAVAPTWGGPLPIVFGKSDKMEFRYALLRNSLRSPGLGWLLYRYGLTSPKNIRMQYVTHVYADSNNVTSDRLEQRTELTRRDGARFAPASFVSGRLDAVATREEYLALVAAMEDLKVPFLVLASSKGPKRSKAEMKALEGARGVKDLKWVSGALLPQEEYPSEVAAELKSFLSSL